MLLTNFLKGLKNSLYLAKTKDAEIDKMDKIITNVKKVLGKDSVGSFINSLSDWADWGRDMATKGISESQFQRMVVEKTESGSSQYRMAMQGFRANKLKGWLKDAGQTAQSLYSEFKRKGLLNDRREYDVEDLMSSYPGLSQSEAKKLYDMIQKDS